MTLWRLTVGAAALVLWALLAGAILRMPAPAVTLAGALQANLAASGADHAVTAVLLNFRGYDTLLEVAVLLLAQAGMLAAGMVRAAEPVPAPPLLALAARGSTPLMVMVAGYLLWAGTGAPGGAFQAGAVLAAALVLLHLGGVMPAWGAPGLALRGSVAGGLLVFLAVAALPSQSGALLHYPAGMAGTLIVLVESALALSIGLTLGGLFLWQPCESGALP